MLRHPLRLLPRAAPRLVSAARASPLPRALCAAPSPACRRQLQQRRAASSTTPASSLADPAELESQKALEQGTEALERGDIEDAKAAYTRSLSIRPSSSAHFNLGVVHYHARDLAAAIAAWEAALELSPDSPDAHTNIASAYVLSKPARPDLAVDHLKKAQALTPDDPEIAYNLAAVLEACEQLEEALVAYKRSLAGGIGRAEQNIRNVGAKILAAKVANETAEAEGVDVAQTIGQAIDSEIKEQEETKSDGREKQ